LTTAKLTTSAIKIIAKTPISGSEFQKLRNEVEGRYLFFKDHSLRRIIGTRGSILPCGKQRFKITPIYIPKSLNTLELRISIIHLSNEYGQLDFLLSL